MYKVEDFINLLESVRTEKVDTFEALKLLNLQLDSEEPLDVQTLRATKEVMAFLRALAKETQPVKKRAILMTLKQALMLFFASQFVSSPEEWWYARELILRGWIDDKSVGVVTQTPAVPFDVDAPRNVVKAFKKLLIELSAYSSGRGFSETLNTVYGYLPAFIRASSMVKAINRAFGLDRRTVIRWVRDFHENGLIEVFISTPKATIPFDKAVELIYQITENVIEKGVGDIPPKLLKKRLLKLMGLPMSLRNADAIYRAVYENGEFTNIVREVILDALYKTLVKYPETFRIYLLWNIARSIHIKTEPFAIFEGIKDGEPVTLEGYYIKEQVLSRTTIVRAFIFRRVAQDGTASPLWDEPVYSYLVYGDEISATDILHRQIIPSIESDNYTLVKLAWWGDETPFSQVLGGQVGVSGNVK
jgi:hypothetical protein